MSATVTMSHGCNASSSTAAPMTSCRRDGRFAGLRGVASFMREPMVTAEVGAPALSVAPEAGRSAKRPAHRPSRRQQIIDAATLVFADRGYVEASVEDIAKAAGV